jgi:rod shape-determining protein MreD
LIRRVVAIGAVLVTGLLLQSTLFPRLTLLGVRPELLYLVTIVVALLEGPEDGAIVGFAGGLFQDFLLDEPKGITALTLTLVGYAIGMSRQYLTSPSPLLPTVMVALGTAFGITFHIVVSFLLGQFEQPIGYAAKVVLLTAVYGAVLTPILYPLLRRVIEGSRARKVVRF